MLLLAYYFILKRPPEIALFEILDPEVEDTSSIAPEYQQVLVGIRVFFFLSSYIASAEC